MARSCPACAQAINRRGGGHSAAGAGQRPLSSRLHRHGRPAAAASIFPIGSRACWPSKPPPVTPITPRPGCAAPPCCCAHGTTTVADIEAVPELLPEVWSSTPLRVISFLEMTGVSSRREPDDILQEAAAKIATLAPRPRPRRPFAARALFDHAGALAAPDAHLAAPAKLAGDDARGRVH